MVMMLLGVISFAMGVVFVSLGAWPVFGFFGLDVALVYFAFRANYRQARGFERVQLSEDALLVQRVTARGEKTRYSLEPYWLRVDMDDPPQHGAPLIVRSGPVRLSIGTFLTPEERLSLADQLKAALVRRKAALIERPTVEP